MRFAHNRATILALTFISLSVIGYLLTFDIVQDVVIDGGSIYAKYLANFASSILVIVSERVTVTISTLGYWGIFLLMFLESTSLPIPSEVILPFSGYLVSLGRFEAWLVILLSTIAGICGSLVDYYIGCAAENWGRSTFYKKFHIGSDSQLALIKKWFDRHGAKAVFFTRMIPGVRTLVSFPAGAARMNISKFVLYTGLGCLFWSSVLVYSGVYLGSHWREFLGILHYLSVGTLVAVVGVALWLLISRLGAARKEAAV